MKDFFIGCLPQKSLTAQSVCLKSFTTAYNPSYFLLVLAVGLFQLNIGIAQSPGGVSTGLQLWLRADQGLSTATVGSTWTNLANPANPATIAGSGQMSIQSNWLNYNPALIHSDGNNDHLRWTTINSKAAFWVGINKEPTAFNHLFYQHSTNLSTTYHGNSGVVQHATDGATQLRQADIWMKNGAQVVANNAWDNTLQIVSVNLKTGDAAVQITSTGGQSSAPDRDLNADIGEIINYDRTLTPTERLQIHSYLAIKYGLTLSSSVSNYLASDGTTAVWNDASYWKNIGVIGRDDNSGLNQKQSKSVNSDAVLTVGLGTIAASNAANTATFGADKAFMAWGAKDEASPQADKPASLSTAIRIAREWKIKETGTVGNVSISLGGIPGNVATLYLLRDADGDFTSGATSTDVTSSVSNGVLNLSGIDFADGEVFTLAYEASAPGGVLANLGMWLKADAGTNTTTDNTAVSGWTEQTTAVAMTQGTAANQPIYRSGGSTLGINFNPAVRFDGSNDQIVGSSNYGIVGGNLFRVFSVIRRSAGTGNQMILASANTSNNVMLFSVNANNQRLDARNVNAVQGTTVMPTNTPILNGFTRVATNSFQFNYMGTTDFTPQSITSFGGSFASANMQLGTSGTGNAFPGEIAEVVAYSTAPSAADVKKVESYLALKYGLTLNSAVGSYVASDGSVLFNDMAYWNNIAGIIRDDASSLNQKQSQSVNTGFQPVVSVGTLANSNQDNAATFSTDRSSLVWGSNTGATTFSTFYAFNTMSHRLNRIWKTQETGTVGSVKVYALKSFFGTATKVNLLVSNDETFDNSDTKIVMTQETVNGVDYYVANVDFTTGQYFTFGAAIVTVVANQAACSGPADSP
nr:hypothetical protein [Spirosomataceae bacterium]